MAYRQANLFHGDGVTKGNRVGRLQRVEIDRDTVGDADLVGAGVSTTDGAGTVVDFVAQIGVAQFIGDHANDGDEIRIAAQGQHRAFDRRD